jgi:hypothetical protein
LNGGAAVSFKADPAVGGSSSCYTINALFQATSATAAMEISNASSALTILLVDNFTIAAVAPVVVTNNTDAAPGSLRAAFATASSGANAGIPNVITFAAGLNGAAITLASELVVDDADEVVVDASSLAAGLTIDGGLNPNRVLTVGGSVFSITPRLTLRKLTLTGGSATGSGGAINCTPFGMLTMSRCTISGNTATGGGGALDNGGVPRGPWPSRPTAPRGMRWWAPRAPRTSNGNATITLEFPLPPESKNIEIFPTDTVVKVSSGTYSLTITRTTGAITGTFLRSDGTTVSYSGTVFQKSSTSTKALGYFLTATPAVKTYNGQSGQLLLQRQ